MISWILEFFLRDSWILDNSPVHRGPAKRPIQSPLGERSCHGGHGDLRGQSYLAHRYPLTCLVLPLKKKNVPGPLFGPAQSGFFPHRCWEDSRTFPEPFFFFLFPMHFLPVFFLFIFFLYSFSLTFIFFFLFHCLLCFCFPIFLSFFIFHFANIYQIHEFVLTSRTFFEIMNIIQSF